MQRYPIPSPYQESRTRILVAIWVVVKVMVLVWIPIIMRHLIFRVPKKGVIILTTTHLSSYSMGALLKRPGSQNLGIFLNPGLQALSQVTRYTGTRHPLAASTRTWMSSPICWKGPSGHMSYNLKSFKRIVYRTI